MVVAVMAVVVGVIGHTEAVVAGVLGVMVRVGAMVMALMAVVVGVVGLTEAGAGGRFGAIGARLRRAPPGGNGRRGR